MGLLRQSVFTVMTVFVAAVGALATAVAVFVAKNGAYVEPSWFLPLSGIVIFGSAVASAYSVVRTGLLVARLKQVEKRLTMGNPNTAGKA